MRSCLPVMLVVFASSLPLGCKSGSKTPATQGSAARPAQGSAARPAQGSAAAATQPKPAAAAPAAAPLADGPLTAESALGWAPASADAVIALTDLRALYGLLADVENTAMVLEAGAAIIKRLHTGLQRAPVPVPWKADDLQQLGLDPSGTFAVIVRKPQVFVLVPLSDAAKFKETLSKAGSWSDETVDGVAFAKFRPRRGRAVYCSISKQRASCSASPGALAVLLKEPQRSDPVYKRLDESQRAAVRKASAFLWLQQRQLDVVATARVTADGLQVEADLHSLAFAQAAKLLGSLVEQDLAQSPLLGLALGSTSRAFVRLPLGALARLLEPRADKQVAALVGDATNFTGEVLALERPGAQLAVVIGTRDASQAQKVVEAVGKLVQAQLAKPRQAKRGKDRPKVTVKGKKIAGKAAYLFEVQGGKTIPISFRWGLAAGPLGIVAGSYALVEKLAGAKQADAKAFLDSLTPEDRVTYGKGAIAALQLAIGDPLQTMSGQLDKLLPANLSPMARGGLTLARFLMDQLDHVSFGQAQVSAQKIRLVASIHTLHRRGNADDDAARTSWREALKTKYGGSPAVFEKALLELAQKYPKTRYATLKDRQQGALFSTMTGIMAAVAIPAFIKYTRRTKALEGRMELHRLAMMARVASPKLPAGDSGWTPKAACCKQPGGRCSATPADWAKPQWKALGYQGRTSAFQYRYVRKGETLTLSARADFDCDGTYTLYTLPAKLRDGKLTTERVQAENEGE